MQPEPNPLGFLILGILVMGILLGCLMAMAVIIASLLTRTPLLPRRPWPNVGWNGVAVVGVFGLWVFLNVLIGLALQTFKGPGTTLTPLDRMAAVSLLNLLLILVMPRFLGLWSPSVFQDLGLSAGRFWKDAGLGVLVAFALAIPVYVIQFAAIQVWKPEAHPLQDMLFAKKDPQVLALAFIAAVILAPIAEELMFRGVLQGWLDRLANPKRGALSLDPTDLYAESDKPELQAMSPISGNSSMGASWLRPRPLLALLLPAALFALVHFAQWPAPIPLFLLAIGLGVLYRKTSGIVAPAAMHATFNALSTVVLIVVVQFNLVPEELLKKSEKLPVAPAESSSKNSSSTWKFHPSLNLQSHVEFFLARPWDAD